MTFTKKFFSLVLLVCLLLLFCITSAAAEEEVVRVTGIRLQDNKTEVTLELGESEYLTAIVFPVNATDRRVLWSNSNPKVVELDINGNTARIISRSPGEATITVRTVDRGYNIDCQVKVIKPVTSIGIEPEMIALAEGETAELNAWIIPRDATDQGILWESQNPGIATVDEDGNVRAVREGEAKIIARAHYDKSINNYTTVNVYASAIDEDIAVTPVEPVTNDDPVPPDSDNNLLFYLVLGLGVLILLAVIIFLVMRQRRAAQPTHLAYSAPAAQQQFRPVLVGLSGTYAGQVIEFENNQATIGRDHSVAQAVYPAENTEVSRKHCTVYFDPASQQFTLVDTSSNGTFRASGERLEQNQEYNIEPGERFSLAESGETFTVELE